MYINTLDYKEVAMQLFLNGNLIILCSPRLFSLAEGFDRIGFLVIHCTGSCIFQPCLFLWNYLNHNRFP